MAQKVLLFLLNFRITPRNLTQKMKEKFAMMMRWCLLKKKMTPKMYNFLNYFFLQKSTLNLYQKPEWQWNHKLLPEKKNWNMPHTLRPLMLQNLFQLHLSQPKIPWDLCIVVTHEWIGYIGIEKMDGSYFNVMGLPTAKLWQKLKRLGFIQLD